MTFMTSAAQKQHALAVAEVFEFMRQHGLVAEVEQSSHLKIRFTNALGSRCCLIVSRSPSSQFAIQQNRAELRRLLRRAAR
jgi:hypothetical protein